MELLDHRGPHNFHYNEKFFTLEKEPRAPSVTSFMCHVGEGVCHLKVPKCPPMSTKAAWGCLGMIFMNRCLCMSTSQLPYTFTL